MVLGEPFSQLTDAAVTLDAEVSPRKLDLVGVSDLPGVFASVGKVNKETGDPLSIPRLANLTKNDPSFPRPYIQKSLRRFWKRADVIEWARAWDQKEGPRFKMARERKDGG